MINAHLDNFLNVFNLQYNGSLQQVGHDRSK